ncbi:MAG: ABC transporter permease [Lachnospiraceae bacterium]
MSLDITCYDVIEKHFALQVSPHRRKMEPFVSYASEGMPVAVNVPYSAMDELVGGCWTEFYSMTVVQGVWIQSLDSQNVANQVVHAAGEAPPECREKIISRSRAFQDVMQSMNQMLGMVTAFISLVAGISLLVGGIGVMNIMLGICNGKNKEIGIRKSLVAQRLLPL